MYVAEVSVNVDEMETVINHALQQATNNRNAYVSCVGNTVTVNASGTGIFKSLEENRIRRAVQGAIHQMVPGCEITWKS